MKKQKIFVFILVAVLCISVLPIFADTLFSGGNGTPDDPYKIANKNDLDEIRNFLGRDIYFIQTANITFGANEYFMPIENEEHQPFKGTYDGNGYKISNLKIHIDRTVGLVEHPFVSLFTTVEGGKLTNIALENIEYTCIGEPLSSLAALVSWIDGGIISNCYATGNISQTETSDGYGYYGGLIATTSETSISNCYSNVNISTDDANALVGGFVADNNGYIENCYSVGEIYAPNAGENNIGGFAGWSYIENIVNCYFDSDVCGIRDARGQWASTSDMKKQSAYQNWDFDTIWLITEDASYPMLQSSVNFLDATVNKNMLKLYFSEELKYYSRPPANSFSVVVDDSSVEVQSVDIEDNTIILTLSTAVDSRQDVYVSYDFTGRGITDISNTKGITEVATRQVRNLTLSESANLTSIALDGATLNEPFSPNITYYTADVENDVAEVRVIVTTEDEGTQWHLMTAWDAPIDGDIVPLYLGRNTFKILANSEDLLSENLYTIVITRKEATIPIDNATLNFEYTRYSNELPEVIILDTSSIPFETKLHVGKSADWILASPDLVMPGDEINVSFDPAFLKSGVYKGKVSIFNANVETLEIPVVLNVYKSNVAEMNSLTIGDTELTRAGNVFNCNVSEWIDNIEIQASALYDGSVVNDGVHALEYGMNNIIVTVVSEDGHTTQNYTVNVYRNPPHLLDSINIYGGTLAPDFSANINNYTATANNNEYFSIYAETIDEYCDIYWEGDVIVSYVDGHEGDIDYVTNVTIIGENVVLRAVNKITGMTETYNITATGWNFNQPSSLRSAISSIPSTGASDGKEAVAIYSVDSPSGIMQE